MLHGYCSSILNIQWDGFSFIWFALFEYCLSTFHDPVRCQFSSSQSLGTLRLRRLDKLSQECSRSKLGNQDGGLANVSVYSTLQTGSGTAGWDSHGQETNLMKLGPFLPTNLVPSSVQPLLGGALLWSPDSRASSRGLAMVHLCLENDEGMISKIPGSLLS